VKFEQLDLAAVGPFTNARLEFQVDAPRLHIVYGPNEAGKSSALRAIVDLLYGFHPRTPDNFLHAYGKLCVGARLRLDDGGTIELVRRKRAKNSLCDESDSPLDEEAFRKCLSDVPRELFLSMFGLDHLRLRQGGEEMVQANGKAGETLFAASAGLSRLHAVHAGLIGEFDSLLKGNQTISIKSQLEYLERIKDEQRACMASVDDWNKLDRSVSELHSQRESIDREIAKLRSEQGRLDRIRAAVIPLGSYRIAIQEWESCKHSPLLPPDFREQVQENLAKRSELNYRLKALEENFAESADEIAQLPNDEDLLKHSDELEVLNRESGSSRTAELQCRKLEGNRDELERQIETIAKGLTNGEESVSPEALRISLVDRSRIRKLANQREGCFVRMIESSRDVEELEREIAEGEGLIADVAQTIAPDRMNELERTLQATGEIRSELDHKLSELNEHKVSIEKSLGQLPFYRRTSMELAKLVLPGLAAIDLFEDSFKTAAQKRATLEEKLAGLRTKQIQYESQLAEIEISRRIPTEQELTDARAERDRRWNLVRAKRTESSTAAWFASKGDDFWSMVRKSDQIVDELRFNADIVAKKAGLNLQLVVLTKEITELEATLVNLSVEEERLRNEWNDRWKECDLTPKSPREMREWLIRVLSLVEMESEAETHRRDIAKLQSQFDAGCKTLLEALGAFGAGFETSKSATVLAHVADILGQARESIARRKNTEEGLKKTRSRLEIALRKKADEEAAWRSWSEAWAAALAVIRLPSETLPDTVEEFLQELERIEQKLEDRDGLARRIAGIHRDTRAFEEHAKQLANDLIPDFAARSSEAIVKELSDRLSKAVANQRSRENFEVKRSAYTAERQAYQDAIVELEASVHGFTAMANCSDASKLLDAATASERRRQLEERLEELKQTIESAAQAQTFEAFIHDVESTDIEKIPAQLENLAAEIKSFSIKRDAIVSSLANQEQQLREVDGNGKFALLAEQQESTLASLSESAYELAVRRVALAMLAKAMERYREKNQGPIIEKAGHYFSEMTNRAYKAIRVDFNEAGELALFAQRTDAGDVGVKALSDGTCDQLFLALRLAALDEWLNTHSKLPFVVDDILVNFDEQRAESTLKVMASFAERTQVMFFTHHFNNVELACRSIPSDKLQILSLKN
jgi:uncharacterized protein YhaN